MITNEAIEATRQTLRERVLWAVCLRKNDPQVEAALDALVAFERAVEAVSQAEQWVEYIGPATGTRAVLDLCSKVLAQIIKDKAGAVQE